MPRNLGYLLALLLTSTACTTSVQTQQPSDEGSKANTDADASAADAAPAEGDQVADEGADEGAAAGPTGPALPDGALCDSDADCGDAQVCEGVGCEAGQGRCVSTERMCTRDLATYCGCDGAEFQSSGSCPGKRYAYPGACEPKLAIGEPCADGRQCASGMCLGEGLEGCGRAAMGTCADAETACTMDLATYCGCNNFEFQGSGSCPNRQFAYRGPCEDDAPR
ncbi:hypothetical protein G6O69_34445 [Pseudenhygromyxa sp. WMMC2535]|uniref:hypothetical protein n=1 Tax=Pseudenhygromyxa sp. WMMC2535 TaxID=2712867 RepID=UPI001553CFEE|nr:hypothetical protein [Pseudenhygromyxa sp. WMMC2535]NVB42973.1 hypothetical protein [Pseudenhygromyxa sp. WMMC2535]